MNSLYGTSIVQSLPEKEFDFLTEQQLQAFDVMTITDDGPEGYFVECDLEYPDELHDSHSDYPLCPESVVITPDDLSPYTKSLAETLGVKTSDYRKLVTNLNAKHRITLHYRALKLYLELGMRLKKIHRVVSFTQRK